MFKHRSICIIGFMSVCNMCMCMYIYIVYKMHSVGYIIMYLHMHELPCLWKTVHMRRDWLGAWPSKIEVSRALSTNKHIYKQLQKVMKYVHKKSTCKRIFPRVGWSFDLATNFPWPPKGRGKGQWCPRESLKDQTLPLGPVGNPEKMDHPKDQPLCLVFDFQGRCIILGSF